MHVQDAGQGEAGFDQVKVAEAADTALTTLFAHFPGGKEALILEDGAERAESLALAVRGRADGVSVLAALHAFFAGRGPFDPDPAPEFLLKTQLVVATPALRAYARRMWTGCEEVLAGVIAEVRTPGRRRFAAHPGPLRPGDPRSRGHAAGPEERPGRGLRPPGARLARGVIRTPPSVRSVDKVVIC
ncbi:TetR/AcrR family transcriptional regulator [Streptomyces sp. NBC_01244]|uniref:TetR/AcrR family transcriptional regulator n=1 Tax=Streptomyces sp. NBC_01244 TaxID=2903797 RepID=UPI002E167715